MHRLSLSADARDLESFYSLNTEVPTAVIYFQCPDNCKDRTAQLLVAFVSSASRCQTAGDLLVVEVATGPTWDALYDKEQFYGQARKKGYRIEGEDSAFMNEVFLAGYTHTSFDEDQPAVEGKLDLAIKGINCTWVLRKL